MSSQAVVEILYKGHSLSAWFISGVIESRSHLLFVGLFIWLDTLLGYVDICAVTTAEGIRDSHTLDLGCYKDAQNGIRF